MSTQEPLDFKQFHADVLVRAKEIDPRPFWSNHTYFTRAEWEKQSFIQSQKQAPVLRQAAIALANESK